MGTAKVQGDLWSIAASDWAIIQEPNHNPLFEAMLAKLHNYLMQVVVAVAQVSLQWNMPHR